MTTKSMIWDWGTPRVIQGFWDLGGIDIPTRLVRTVLTDRGNGQLWLWEYNSTAGIPGILQPAPSATSGSDRNVDVWPNIPLSPPGIGDEPFVASGPGYTLQLFVRNGIPGFDFTARSPQWGAPSSKPFYLRTTLPATSIQGTPSQQLARMTQASTFNPLNPRPQAAVSFQSPISVP